MSHLLPMTRAPRTSDIFQRTHPIDEDLVIPANMDAPTSRALCPCYDTSAQNAGMHTEAAVDLVRLLELQSAFGYRRVRRCTLTCFCPRPPLGT